MISLCPMSRVLMASISLLSKVKSQISRFSSIRSFLADFGITMIPCWICHRSNDLGCTFFIPVSNLTKQAMLKNISLSFRKRSPCLRLDFVPIHCLDCRSLLMEGMDLNLVDCRQNLMIDAQIYQTGFIKVADSNGPDDPIPVHFFHRPPCAVVIAKWLIDQVEVQILSPSRSIDALAAILAAS